MASKLERTISDLNTKKIELESIVESITNGIVAVDGNNKVILINPAAFTVLIWMPMPKFWEMILKTILKTVR